MVNSRKERIIWYEPKDLAGLMKREKLTQRLLEVFLARHKIKIDHVSLGNYASGKTDPGFYKWCSIDAALCAEFPPDQLVVGQKGRKNAKPVA